MVKIGDFVRVEGNWGAWEYGYVIGETADGRYIIGYGGRNTPRHLLRLGCEMPVERDRLEVLETEGEA